MGIVEITLLVIGIVAFIVSFILPEKSENIEQDTMKIVNRIAKESVKTQIDAHGVDIEEMLEEKISHSMDKTERGLERLSNEKITAVMEYSDTVLSQIKNNHDEVVFLYDMLNNKETALKKTVSDLNVSVKNAQEDIIQEVKEVSIESTEDKTEIEVKSEKEKPKSMAELERNLDEMLKVKVELGDDLLEETHNHNEVILQYYQEGKSKIEIAQELGLGVGEVKLVIDLFHQNK